ncbi:MAG: PD-(D/E)XK nuclease domain-containing protein, partial [Lachnospiraceae bacterium]|nr:PD-(D/E)XK nuclease domain-containing protein [Lachnospiraceae bacterium]
VIKRAYFSYGDEYIMFEELPAGAGYADIVYLPKKDSVLPVLVIELKWNQSAEGAIKQIRDRRYPDAVSGYGGDILLVGISYDREAPAGERRHRCRIERY